MHLFKDEAQISPLLKQYFLIKVYVFPLKLLFFSKYSDCGLQTGDEMQTKDCRPKVKCRLGSKKTRFPGPRKSWEAGNNCLAIDVSNFTSSGDFGVNILFRGKNEKRKCLNIQFTAS